MRIHLIIHAFVTIVLIVGEIVLPTAGMLILVAVAGVFILITIDRLWHAMIRRERRIMVDLTIQAFKDKINEIQAEKA